MLAEGRQSLSFARYEVIVSDDGSGFPAESFCREKFPWVRYTHGPQKGPAANRNNGASLAAHAWLVFLDDDCVPDRDLLEQYQKGCLANPGNLIFEGCILPIGEKLAYNYECPVNKEGGVLWSCNMMVDKGLFLRLGGFDEEYPFASMEDVDFRLRVMKEGKILFNKGAMVYHPWTKVESPQVKFERAYQSHIIFLKKWPRHSVEFGLSSIIRKMVSNLMREVLPNFILYKGKGINYVLSYYHFLFRLTFSLSK
jgi:GT2 family glycosyltransferase